MWLQGIILISLIGSSNGLGCMSPVCGANADTKLKDCDPKGDSFCGQYGGKR